MSTKWVTRECPCCENEYESHVEGYFDGYHDEDYENIIEGAETCWECGRVVCMKCITVDERGGEDRCKDCLEK